MSAPSASDLRREFLLDPEIAFLNHGLFGACPRPVPERYQAWQRELEREPIDFLDRRLPAASSATSWTEPLAPETMLAQRWPPSASPTPRLFTRHRVEIPVGGRVNDLRRLSAAAYTTGDDIDRLLTALVRELDAEHRQQDE